MAAAYAALVSLTNIIEQIMENHARHPIFSDAQRRLIESLQQKVSFLIDFLEVYSNGGIYEAEGLESRIADAAYAAEDIIESHVVDTILYQTPNEQPNKNVTFDTTKSCLSVNEKNTSKNFSQGLQKVLENIDSIREEVVEIKEKRLIKDQQTCDPLPVVSSRQSTNGKDIMMEYYNDDLEQIMDKLVGQSSNLQIIPIVGMGGIGKTTLARYVYDNPLVVEHFDIRAWVTISQEYYLREMLFNLLKEIGIRSNKTEQESNEYHQLGEKLHKYLSGRKYLIIMDDIWSIEACEKLELFFPNNNNGSRVVITTRLSNVAGSSGSSHLYKMNLLDEKKSWSLLCKKVFGHDGNCPLELEKIGKDIARNCKGLPLSIVVTGGLLAKSDMTQRYWKNVAKDINQIVTSEDDGYWLKTLSLSYSHLPIHLKPCFLYMGVYPEDCKINISILTKRWVAEGFLKPNISKSLEEIAEDYLKDLVERNLILVSEWGSIGKMKRCSIHDLLRDLCLKEAQKQRFFSVNNDAQSINNQRRIVFHEDWSRLDSDRFERAFQSTTCIRSLSCEFDPQRSSWESGHNLRLLRVLTAPRPVSNNILQLVNLRYLYSNGPAVFSSMYRLWQLQTLILSYSLPEMVAPNEIWEMPQLRHLMSRRGFHLPDPLRGGLDGQDDLALKKLETLGHTLNFKCTEEVVKRIPNIKKLSIGQRRLNVEVQTSNDYYCLRNLSHLHKLQSLTCHFGGDSVFFQNVVFPQSLKKLMLNHCRFDWDDFTEKVGSLPHLQKLKLWACRAGEEWNTVEGKFLCLKFLHIDCIYLDYWATDSTHFPLLECLVLENAFEWKEFPSDIVGDTLQSIKLVGCGSSVVDSARAILEEQHSNGNEGLCLTVSEGDGYGC